MIYYSMMPSLWDALGGHSGSAESLSARPGRLKFRPGSQSGTERPGGPPCEVQTPRLCQDSPSLVGGSPGGPAPGGGGLALSELGDRTVSVRLPDRGFSLFYSVHLVDAGGPVKLGMIGSDWYRTVRGVTNRQPGARRAGNSH
eukprot:753482-Hanusia_phi.AAC.3